MNSKKDHKQVKFDRKAIINFYLYNERANSKGILHQLRKIAENSSTTSF